MSQSNEKSSKITDDDTTIDSGFISCEQQHLSGFIEANEEADKVIDSADMSRAIAGNSPSFNDSVNTDSGFLSTNDSIKDVIAYVPKYLRDKAAPVPRISEKFFEQDEDGDTKLHLAILQNNEQAIFILVNYSTPSLLNIRNFYGQSALHLATHLQQYDTIRMLINAGADINTRDNQCNSPLHIAIAKKDLHAIKIITAAIDKSNTIIANLEQWNFEGESGFYLACKLDSLSIARHLLKAGANVNSREGKSGYTSLHYAVEMRATNVVKFLCDECSNCDLDVENYGGFTAYQIALLTCQYELADYLISKGATPFYTPESDYDESESDEEEEEEFEYEINQSNLVNKIAEIAVN